MDEEQRKAWEEGRDVLYTLLKSLEGGAETIIHRGSNWHKIILRIADRWCDLPSADAEAVRVRDEIRELKEFRCRTNEAFRTIQGDIHYSQKVKLETAIYGSFSCVHEDEAKLFKERYELEQIRYEGISSANEELRGENKRLREDNRNLLEGLKCVADFASIPPRVSHDAANGKEEIDKLIADIALDLLKRVKYRIRREAEGK